MFFRSPSIDELVTKLQTVGGRSRPRGLATLELVGVALDYRIGTFPTREGMSFRLAEVEAAQMVAGIFDLESIQRAAPGADLSLFTEQAAYGPILASQLPRVVQHLREDPATRRAVLYLGSVRTQLTDAAPCTNSLQFLVRSGLLHLVVSMRSWDVVYGLPNDIAAFGLVAQVVAKFLGLVPGRLFAAAGSLHLYEETAHKAVSGSPELGITRVDERVVWPTWTSVVMSVTSQLLGGRRVLMATKGATNAGQS